MKVKLQNGERVFGAFVPFLSPTVVEMLGLVGFEFVIIDCEHSPMTPSECEQMVRAAECVNIVPLVRVAVNMRQNILRYLDIGSIGVQIPMVNTGAEAEEVVAAVKYPPEGKRGLAGVRAASYGLTGPLGDYVKVANQETLVSVQIETTQGVENVKAIADTPGVDVVFIGPNDLSSGMGYAGQVTHPEVIKTINYLVKEIKAAGKAAGTVAYTYEILRRVKPDFQFIVYNVWPMIQNTGKEWLKVAKE